MQEKIAFCTGADFWRTKELPRLGVPAIKMSDGPHGLRCQEGEADMIGVNSWMLENISTIASSVILLGSSRE